MSDRGRTIRDAIMLALESTPARPGALHHDQGVELVAVRNHVLAWVHSYAEHRGVILAEEDVAGELDAVLGELRGAGLSEPPPGKPIGEMRGVKPMRLSRQVIEAEGLIALGDVALDGSADVAAINARKEKP